MIGKTRDTFELGHATYTHLFNVCISPVMHYGVGVWSVKGKYPKIDRIQSSAIHYFCRLPKKAPVLGYIGDMGWTPSIVRRDLEVLCTFNQIVCMSSERIP